MNRVALTIACLLTACGGPQPSATDEEAQTYVGYCTYRAFAIDGDTLAEQPWTDGSQSHFYEFTGNGSYQNTSGTFRSIYSPPCLRQPPYCAIATREYDGRFYTSGSTVTLVYYNGSVAYFNATIDCHNRISLAGTDWPGKLTLTVSSLP